MISSELFQLFITFDRTIGFSGFVRFSPNKDELFTVMLSRTKRAFRITAVNIHTFGKRSFGLDGDNIRTLSMQPRKIQSSTIRKRKV
ncbi:hypothetical protein D3C76_1474720 [compost metagenome]